MNGNFNTLAVSDPSRQSVNITEGVSNSMDRNFRIFMEGETTNKKVYKESTTLAKVNVNLGNLRTKPRHFYERVPQERVDEYN